MLAALLALVRVHAHAEEPLSPTCGSEQCTGSDDAVLGTEFLYDGNTVILAEGTQEEMQEPGWDAQFEEESGHCIKAIQAPDPAYSSPNIGCSI